MSIKWTATFGPFEDDSIALLAVRMGWDSSSNVTSAQFVQDKLFAQITETLSSAKKEQVTQDLMNQIAQVQAQVDQEVANSIVVEAEIILPPQVPSDPQPDSVPTA